MIIVMVQLKAKSHKPAKAFQGNFNFAEGSYLESTSRPLYALLFLLPLVAIYELGTLLVNTDQIAHTQARVATFTWLMGLAELLGMQQSLAWAFPGLVVVVILLCLHLNGQDSWRIRPGWLGWMAVESVLLTVPLFAMGSLVKSSEVANAAVNGGNDSAMMHSYLAKVITSVGAGIYEELAFRLILFGLLLMLLEDVLKAQKLIATVFAVIISALLFAGHHYVGLQGGRITSLEEFELGGFIFRAAAGVYFAVIFHYRGYGIVAGTHSAFNIILFAFS